MEILSIPQAKYRFVPAGGGTKPMAKFTAIMMPKWMSFTSMTVAIDSNAGGAVKSYAQNSLQTLAE